MKVTDSVVSEQAAPLAPKPKRSRIAQGRRIYQLGITAAIVLGAITGLINLLTGGQETLKMPVVRADLARSISAQVQTPVQVSCPQRVVYHKGGTFTCTASANGQSVHIVVTERSDSGGTLSYAWKAKP